LVLWVAILTKKNLKQKYSDIRSIYISSVKSSSMVLYSFKSKHLMNLE
jgi:hypothetical protein